MVSLMSSLPQKLTLFFEDIADPFYGVDHFLLELSVDFHPEPVDMYINNIAWCIKIVSPDMLKDHGSGEYLTGISHKILKKRKFFSRKFNIYLVSPGYPGNEIKCEIAYG